LRNNILLADLAHVEKAVLTRTILGRLHLFKVGQAAGIDALLDVPFLARGQGLVEEALVLLGRDLWGVAWVVGVAAPLLHGHEFLGDGDLS
jgi:hypothetical protein